MRTYQDAKAMAKSLRDSLAARNVSLSHGDCLEIVAQQFGFVDWNTLSAKLNAESARPGNAEVSGSALQPAIPVIRVGSVKEAVSFYGEFLGFAVDWGGENASRYAQISRSDATIHLAADPRAAAVLIRMQGLDALHRELANAAGSLSPGDIRFTPWDSRVFSITDPWGSTLRFWENNAPGVAEPIRRKSPPFREGT